MAQIHKRQNFEQNIESSKSSLTSRSKRSKLSLTRDGPRNINERIEKLVKDKEDYYLRNFEQKRIKEEIELEKCSFRPKTNPRKRVPLQITKVGGKHKELFDMSK